MAKIVGISGLGTEPVLPRTGVPVPTTAPPRPGEQTPVTPEAPKASSDARSMVNALAIVGVGVVTIALAARILGGKRR